MKLNHNARKYYKTRIYNIGDNMKRRATNINHRDYHVYGGADRGLDDERGLSFSNFLEDMEEGYSDDLTLDRIDNDKGYSKENCRWADRYVQMRNMSRNRIIKFNNESRPLSEGHEMLEEELGGIRWQSIQSRLNRGWTPEEALTIPKGTIPKGMSFEYYKNNYKD